MNILFRADSSSSIGTGHIMRDLVLAQQFPNDNIIFATKNLEGNINFKIKESGFKIELLKTNQIEELNTLINKFKIDMLIIDNYDIDYRFEKQLKIKNPKLKIFVLDDTYEKHYCDILLNHNISADEKKYKDLVPDYCELRCGSRFTLIREEFYNEKKKLNKKIFNTKKYNLKTIFIAMGGADHSNVNIDILKTIKKLRSVSEKKVKVNLVTTTANRNLKKLKKYCKNKKWLMLHINSSEIARLMVKSGFSIVTPSVIVNEVYFMELPFIAIKTASNQEDIYKYLKKNRFNTLNSFNEKKLKKELIKFLK